MGNFRLEIDGIGGHGCQREVRDGGKVDGCGLDYCLDCLARRFVAELKNRGVFNYGSMKTQDGIDYPRAVLTHWPGSKEEVKDDLLTGIRKGSF